MINPLSLALPPAPAPQQNLGSLLGGVSAGSSQPKGVFGQMLSDAMGHVVNQQARMENLVEDHLLGRPVADVEALTAIKQAELTLKTMLQVRNKAVEAYKELKQIQV